MREKFSFDFFSIFNGIFKTLGVVVYDVTTLAPPCFSNHFILNLQILVEIDKKLHLDFLNLYEIYHQNFI